MQQQPIPPQQPISVRLAAEQWDYVLRLLYEAAAPMRMTLPIARDIETQCLAANNAALEELPDA